MGSGLSEESFEAIQGAFDAFSPQQRRTTAPVDRSGLDLPRFADVLRRLGAAPVVIDNAKCLFDVCHDARSSSEDGAGVPIERLVAACVAIHCEALQPCCTPAPHS